MPSRHLILFNPLRKKRIKEYPTKQTPKAAERNSGQMKWTLVYDCHGDNKMRLISFKWFLCKQKNERIGNVISPYPTKNDEMYRRKS